MLNSVFTYRRRIATIVFLGIVAGAVGILIASHYGLLPFLNARGHARMLDLLQKLKTVSVSESSPVGNQSFQQALDALNALPADTSTSQRSQLHAKLAKMAISLGQTKSAIEHYEKAYELREKAFAELEQGSAVGTNFQKGKQQLEVYYDFLLFQLGVSHLRQGEVENCIHCQTGESCIVPIRSGGVHTRQDGSREAIKVFSELLNRNPGHLGARWLLNVAYMTIGGYPDEVPARHLISPKAFESDQEFPRFANIAASVGLNTVSLSGGSIADDFDNDGLLDIVASTCNGQIRYFRNNGDGTFFDRTKETGLEGFWAGLNIIQADYDNDGYIDILVLRGAWGDGRKQHYPNSLLRNENGERFRDVTFESGLGKVHRPTQTGAWADFDNDGDLDLYIGNENLPCQLFENNGKGRFTDIAKRAGVENDNYTKGVVWGDYDNDRLPDLYVSNLGSSNRLYHNNGDGTFTDVAAQAGVQNPFHGFPVWFWDFNNDGNLDIFAATYHGSIEDVCAHLLGKSHLSELDRLYQGDGKGGFKEVAVEQQLTAPTLAMGANFGDLDNDGFPDFYVGTGNPEFESIVPNLMYRNLGGSGFADVTTAGGFGHLQKGHGVSFADLDNDGDQDVFAELGGAYVGDPFTNALFENPGFGHHWIKLKLVGRQSNRCAIGARIRAEIEEAGETRSVYKWVNSGGSFGANPLRQEIGLGKADKINRLEVYWPTSDQTQSFDDVPVDQFIEVAEGETEYHTLSLKTFALNKDDGAD